MCYVSQCILNYSAVSFNMEILPEFSCYWFHEETYIMPLEISGILQVITVGILKTFFFLEMVMCMDRKLWENVNIWFHLLISHAFNSIHSEHIHFYEIFRIFRKSHVQQELTSCGFPEDHGKKNNWNVRTTFSPDYYQHGLTFNGKNNYFVNILFLFLLEYYSVYNLLKP